MNEDFRQTLYYAEDLEIFDAETETGIIENQKCKHRQEDGYTDI